ncbi:MAG: hypothetical protein IT204_17920 [Fimbriimonadaceae bacterium]|nr:hypothetical protein [Fimbriimonadaceae bacterium]
MKRWLDRLSPTATLLCYVAGWVVWGTLMLGAAARPWRQYQQVIPELRYQLRELAAERALVRELPAARRRSAQLRSDLAGLEVATSARLYVPTLVTQLADLASGAELALVGVVPDAGETARLLASGGTPPASRGEASAPGRRLVTVTLKGRYAGLGQLLEAFQSAPKLLAVRRLTITPVAGSATGEVLAELGLVAYEAPGIPDPTAPAPPSVLTARIWQYERRRPSSPGFRAVVPPAPASPPVAAPAPPSAEPTPEPPADEPAPQPPGDEPAPEPPGDEPAPQPPADEPAPQPPGDEPAPEPPGPTAGAPPADERLPRSAGQAPPRMGRPWQDAERRARRSTGRPPAAGGGR